MVLLAELMKMTDGYSHVHSPITSLSLDASKIQNFMECEYYALHVIADKMKLRKKIWSEKKYTQTLAHTHTSDQ